MSRNNNGYYVPIYRDCYYPRIILEQGSSIKPTALAPMVSFAWQSYGGTGGYYIHLKPDCYYQLLL